MVECGGGVGKDPNHRVEWSRHCRRTTAICCGVDIDDLTTHIFLFVAFTVEVTMMVNHRIFWDLGKRPMDMRSNETLERSVKMWPCIYLHIPSMFYVYVRVYRCVRCTLK